MFFPSSKPLESSVMVLPLLSLIAVFLWVPSLQRVFVIPYRVFVFALSAACCASSIRLLSHSLLTDFKLFLTSSSLLLYFARSCCWILWDLAFSDLPLSCFRSSTQGWSLVCYFSFSYPTEVLQGSHGRNNRFFFLWKKTFFLMQNIFIVPAMQYGCRAKPLYILCCVVIGFAEFGPLASACFDIIIATPLRCIPSSRPE